MKMKNENNSFDLAISYYREEKSFTESRNKKNNKNCDSQRKLFFLHCVSRAIYQWQ